VNDQSGAHWLRVPAPSKDRTVESILRSGRLVAYFGHFAVGKDGRKYQEVGPDKMPLSSDDMHFLQEECTAILLDDGYIFEDSSSSTGYRDSHCQEWSFPKTTCL
jgi:hypothetical protein